MKSVFAFYFIVFLVGFVDAQNHTSEIGTHRKGEFYFYIGWNRGWFTNSDITFKGDDYNFTIKNVAAKDRQSPFNLDTYLNPTKFTIPQYNFRMGYFFNDHFSISIGTDHMKYVMIHDQTVKISGFISDSDTEYNGVYNDDQIKLKNDFLQFEHTDGLNYINTEVRRFDNLINFRKVNINIVEGAGVGMLFPRTNTTLLDKDRYDQFHVAGYGLSALLGLNVKFLKYFFVQSELKGGYINMPDIRTTKFTSDRASQHFLFLQSNILFGASFSLTKGK